MSFGAHIEALGARALGGLRGLGQLGLLMAAATAGVVRGHRRPGETLRQMYEIGNRSILFIAVTLGSIGMVMVYQSSLQLERITGDLSQVGPEFASVLIQDFGPTITALMLATRVGAGIAAEIGSMKVTEQLDALRMSGVRPVDYLIVPRLIASFAMVFALAIFGTAIAFAAGGLTAYLSFELNPRVYFDLSRVTLGDVGLGAVKTASYGLTIPVIAGFCGMQARGSSEGVGWATTAAVIGSSLAVIVLNFVISGLGIYGLGVYGLGMGAP
jgi:phospholipid/cholesterol/gamma-HCH transport system permease protein